MLLFLLLIKLAGLEAIRLIGLGLKLKTLFEGVLASFNGRRITFVPAGVLGMEAFVDAGFLWFSDEGLENLGEFLPSLCKDENSSSSFTSIVNLLDFAKMLPWREGCGFDEREDLIFFYIKIILLD